MLEWDCWEVWTWISIGKGTFISYPSPYVIYVLKMGHDTCSLYTYTHILHTGVLYLQGLPEASQQAVLWGSQQWLWINHHWGNYCWTGMCKCGVYIYACTVLTPTVCLCLSALMQWLIYPHASTTSPPVPTLRLPEVTLSVCLWSEQMCPFL